jgi:hypothetical protein
MGRCVLHTHTEAHTGQWPICPALTRVVCVGFIKWSHATITSTRMSRYVAFVVPWDSHVSLGWQSFCPLSIGELTTGRPAVVSSEGSAVHDTLALSV